MSIIGPSHKQNQKLWDETFNLASENNYELVHNTSSFSSFAGSHRYLLLNKGASNKTIRSLDCVLFDSAPYSRYYKPSIVGEKRALTSLYVYLSNIIKK